MTVVGYSAVGQLSTNSLGTAALLEGVGVNDPSLYFHSFSGTPSIGQIFYGNQLFATDHSLYIYGNLTVTKSASINDNLDVWSNLVVHGTATFATNVVLSVTNYTTNAFFADAALWATNLVYLTNSGGLSIDMAITYRDNTWGGGGTTMTFSGIQNKSTDAYQTAVVLIHNASGSNTPVNVVFAGAVPQPKITGAPWLTNDTVMTVFYNPAIPITNASFLPIW